VLLRGDTLLLQDLFASNFSTELVVLGLLLWLGYLGARVVSRLRLPQVTGFLLMGIILGPSIAGFLSHEVLKDLEFIEPLALGIIIFLIGEELTTRMLRRHRWQFWFTSALNILLPTAFVTLAVLWYRPETPALAWVLGAIAMSGAPATIMAVLTEKRARGRMCDTLLGCAALDNIACIVAFAIVVPYIQLASGVRTSVFGAISETAMSVLGAVAIGAILGWVLVSLLRRVTDKSEMLAIAFAHIVLSVAVAEAIGVSALLAPLAAGIVTATFEERLDSPRRVFESLRAVEFPVYILFFTIAGASLELGAVISGGFLVLVYIAARSLGKFTAGFAGGMAQGLPARPAAWFGLGFLPQAGVAVGLALNAAVVFPDIGSTINAVVLAAIVVFEILGPISTGHAIDSIGECEVEDEKAGSTSERPRKTTVLVPVSYAFSRDRLLFLLQMTSAGRPDARFILTHIVTHSRAVIRAEGLRRGQAILDELRLAAQDAGFEVGTSLVESTNVGAALSQLAEETGAELVVIGSGQERSLIRRSLVKTPMHKILDDISIPVLVVPEHFRHGEEVEEVSGPACVNPELEHVEKGPGDA